MTVALHDGPDVEDGTCGRWFEETLFPLIGIVRWGRGVSRPVPDRVKRPLVQIRHDHLTPQVVETTVLRQLIAG